MSQLVKFGDVVLKVNDKVDPQEAGLERYVAGEHMVTDDPFLREYGLVGDGYLGPAFQMRFKPGHILYGSRRTYLRKVAMSSFEGVCANTTFVLRPVNDKLAKEFLLHVMSTERFHAHSILQSKGSVNPYINFSDLVDYEFELPSVDEQARIVELMTAVDEHLDALRNQLEIAKSSRSAVLYQLLSAGGDDWVNTTLGNIAEVIMGRQLSPGKKMGVRPKPYLRAANIGNWGINIDDLLEMDFTESEERQFASQIGDVLLVEGGNEKSVGCPALIGELEEGLCIQNTIIRCRVKDSNILSPNFLYHSLRQSFWSGKFGELCAGTTIMHLGQKRAMIFPFDLPPIAEQERIVEIVSSMDDVIQATEQAIAEAKVLRTTLLNQEIS
jgi:type I restriction enzyme S subunit